MKQRLFKIAKILGIAAGILLLLFLLTVYLISTPYIQTKATAFITDYAKNNYGIDAKIDYINLSLKGGVTIEGVYLPDEYGDTLAYIGKATVAFYPKKVYKNDFLSLRSVEIDDAKAYLWNDTLKNRFCFDYIVEALSSDDEEEDTTPSKFDMAIGSINIENLHFKYFVYGTPDTLSKEINYDYLDFSNINLEGELNSIKLDAFSASIDHLSLNEKSGLEISDLMIKDFSTTHNSLLASLVSLKSKDTDISISNIEIESEGGLSEIGNAFTKGKYKFEITDSHISPSDFSTFYLPLQKLDKRLTLNTTANGRFPALAFDKLSAEYGGGIVLSLSGAMQDYTNFDKCDYMLRIDTVGATADGLKSILSFADVDSLPAIIDSIFPIGLSANINGAFEKLSLNAALSSSLGRLDANGTLSMNFENDFAMLADAKLSSYGMCLNSIMPDSILIDSLAYDLDIMYAMKGDNMRAEAKGLVSNVRYSDGTNNITLHDFAIDSAAYIPNIAFLSFQISEPFAKANLATKVDFGNEKLKVKTNGGITYFKPDLIGLTDSIWIRKRFSMGIDGDVNFSTVNDLVGTITLDSIVLADSLTIYKLGDLTLSASETLSGRKIDIASQIMDATLTGEYDLSKLNLSLNKALNPYVPTLCPDTTAEIAKNDFVLKAKIKNTHSILGFFNIPIDIPQVSSLRFSIDSTNAIEFYANIPQIAYEGKKFNSNVLSIKKGGRSGQMLVADLHSDVDLEGFETINLDVANELENDVVLTNIAYNNRSEDEPILGNLKALLTFPKDTLGNTILKTFFMPSDLIMRDLWLGFEPSIITLNSNGKVDVENFGLIADDDKRILNINGTIGEEKTDSVLVSFDSLMIAEVSAKLRTGVPISGIVNGDICLKSLLATPQYRTSNLCINSLKYDNNLVGDMRIKSGMGGERRGIGTKIEIDKDGKNICSARGVVMPEQQLVRLTFETKELPINFAETFLSDYISDVKGTVSANINVNGKITSPFVNGYLYINNASAKVNYTNTSYRVNDSIIFTPEQFRIKDLTITDDLGNKAKVNCIINHNHLRDFDYMARISMDEFLLLNNPKAKNEMVYGKFMAGGRIRISGDEKQANIEGTISNGNSESTLTVVLPESETTAATYSNIVFISKKDTTKKEEETAKRDSAFKITTNVTLDIKDNLDMGVVLSRSTGDNCKVKGEGNIRLEYSSEQSEPKLYGTYTISEGALKMKLSKLPLKPFSIEKGSNFNISGPISSLNFDIKSHYTTRADLATLDESFANDPSLSNTRVPAAAVLTIGGTMDKVNLGYDITLPNSSEELKERVRSIVNTDELKICEFAYIIALNSFYSISGNSAAVSSTMLSSIASTSISNGMNTLLGDVLGSNWSVGADITSTESDMSDMEMSFTISRSFFNNRVVLSTDLGYQNQTNANGSSVEFTNNFDLEYKLTPSGMFRLKGYRHDNDEFYRQNSSKQGVGFLFTREAPTFYELFKKGGKK